MPPEPHPQPRSHRPRTGGRAPRDSLRGGRRNGGMKKDESDATREVPASGRVCPASGEKQAAAKWLLRAEERSGHQPKLHGSK